MSCDFTYSPTGRAGIGVIQPQSGLDYPLVQPSADIRYLLADFYLAFDDAGEYAAATQPAQLPLRIQYLYRIGCADSELPLGAPEPRTDDEADIVVVDNAGTVIFDSTAGVNEYHETDWGPDYKIYAWRTAAGVCRLVAYTTWAETDGDARQYATYLAPENATLDPRAVYKMPRRVLSLSVRQSSGPVVQGPYRGKFVFRNGYNTLLEAADATNENFIVNTNVNFSAEAGTGQGYYPICGDVVDEETNENIPQPIITINGINGTPDGNFLLVGNDCIYVRRPTAETEACVTYVDPVTGEPVTVCASKATPLPYIDLQMGTDCPPCCECGDYVSTALYMNTVYGNYKKISDYTTKIKNTHEENIRRWAERVNCNSPLKLALVAQNCPYLDVVAMICNQCEECFQESKLTLTLESESWGATVPPQAEIVCGYTELVGGGKNKFIEIAIENSNGAALDFNFDMPAVNADGGSAYVKFRVKFGATPDLSVASTAALQEIPLAERAVGLLVRTADTNKFWTLGENLNVWLPSSAGVIPQTVTGTLSGYTEILAGEEIVRRPFEDSCIIVEPLNCAENGDTARPC